MTGFLDLHCHFVPKIDDGVRSDEESLSLLRALREVGFSDVVATPHMRPGLFDNTADALLRAYEALLPALSGVTDIPRVSLSSEHYFDDVVFRRLLEGGGLPYPGGHAALLEFYDMDFLPMVAERLFDLRRKRIVPVIAHPERYRCFWKSHDKLNALIDAGAVALLDTAALVGKYGKEPQKAASRMLDDGVYHAACSDAHRAADVEEVEQGMRVIEKRHGAEEVEFLFRVGPREILDGKVTS